MDSSALLVAKNGELIHEQYFGKHTEDRVSNSFSMAKAVTTLLAGKALEEGYLSSLDQKVTEFYPQYQYSPADHLTVLDLIRMSSGMDWEESYYLPFNVTTEAYYGKHLDKLILSRKIIHAPGKDFLYQSGNTHLLAMILSKVLPVYLSDYLSEKFWKPMGMEHTAYWTIDPSSGVEKGYCCVHAVARDFMKLGQMMLQDGEWRGEQLISKDYLDIMRKPGFETSPMYGGGLWMNHDYKPGFYMMRGHLGQFVIVVPEHDLVIGRLGQKCESDGTGRMNVKDIYNYLDGVLEMIGISR